VGTIFILSSPSGAGKTTLAQELCKNNPHLSLSLSATTRPSRSSERNGVDYIFLNQEEFLQWKAEDKFVEWAEIFGHYYGTPYQSIKEVVDQGKDMLLVIDWQGTQQLQKRLKNHIVTIFVLPPSQSELKERLIQRSQDSHGVIDKRMAVLDKEIGPWKGYDYTVINRDFRETVSWLQAILTAEKFKTFRQKNLSSFVEALKS
jgi:guanylate kinase